MLLYSDVLTGDEMFSDAFPVCVSRPKNRTSTSPPPQQADRRHRLRGRLPNHHGQAGRRRRHRHVPPLGSIPPAHPHTGANPSAEDQAEALEDGAVQVNNVVFSFRLQKVEFDKKSYLGHIKVLLSIFPPPISPSSTSDCRTI